MSTKPTASSVSAESVERAIHHLVHQTNSKYFHGYQISLILLRSFFLRFSKFTNYGMCYGISALVMLTFRDDPTSRIVRGYCGDERSRHSWMEFCLDGEWWVVDPGWLKPCLIDRDRFYAMVRPEIYYVCEHAEFWSYPISSQLEQRINDPATSYIFYELLDTYSWYIDHECAFHPEISTKETLDEDVRRKSTIGLTIRFPEIIFSQRIVNEFMLDENRSAPKGHTVRKVRRLQRIIREDYARFVKEYAESGESPAS